MRKRSGETGGLDEIGEHLQQENGSGKVRQRVWWHKGLSDTVPQVEW